ncbi:MAG: DUF4384 domain-containing protein [Magnetococcales bacterium]|uniref:DUF4384 domain-containing protein n=1 Tax=Candidatus Magnetobacterium casense TaxID=1455061 RepID=UPI000590E979|nr:DUF4384 domain-containing protein [Candidatus Magnetobacterium casensis]MBF0338574.1 DUF4384 domain-containing protein [Nitrospirota bacterium]MBF0606961.1 DUF4384 domain-containing protein [Nitrospirota bacterium]
MSNRLHGVICVLTIAMLALVGGITVYSAEPTGAKGLFENEGSKISVSTERKKTTVTETTRVNRRGTGNVVNVAYGPHVGIKYTVMLIGADGFPRPVSGKRVFRTGDRIKIIAQSNRPGNLAVYNVGPTGNVNYLFKGPVTPFTPIEIPQTTAMRIVDPPGTEAIFFELSGASDRIPVEAGPTCKPNELMASASGSRDIVVEDTIGTNYAVYSRENCSIESTGSKDIVLESDNGNNYGVVPSALIEAGKSFLVQVRLKHRG